MRKVRPGREAYIREQMRKRLGQDADEVAATSSQMHPEDELYAVPSDLQVRAIKAGLDSTQSCCYISSCSIPVVSTPICG